MSDLGTARWDVVDHLGSTNAMVGYLEAVLEDGDPLLIAIGFTDVVGACERHELALQAGKA